jgi:hypothetical protein
MNKNKRQKQLMLIWFNNWLNGQQKLQEFVFLSGGIAYVVGGFRIECIVMGIGFVVQLNDKQLSDTDVSGGVV